MKVPIALIFSIVLGVSSPLAADEVPREAAGFTLGGDVAAVAERLQMDTALALRYQEYLQEVEIRPLPGYKSGLIAFGTCARPGGIVRIKLKYIDASRAFYDALLARVEKRFGKASAYEGDPFHIVVEWKWSFVADDGRKITLHLGHNNQDLEEKFGNTLKLTLVSAVQAERRCYLEKHPGERRRQSYERLPLNALDEEDWEAFVPH